MRNKSPLAARDNQSLAPQKDTALIVLCFRTKDGIFRYISMNIANAANSEGFTKAFKPTSSDKDFSKNPPKSALRKKTQHLFNLRHW